MSNTLKLYLIEQNHNDDYDTYDSAIVCASTPEEACNIHPGGDNAWDGKKDTYNSWCDMKYVTAEPIGHASNGVERGVVCASFNAG